MSLNNHPWLRKDPSQFGLSHYRLFLVPREVIILPRLNKGITLRGAFGSAFRSLVCADRKAKCHECSIHPTCPYGFIFAPRVPPEAKRLRLNQDIPRPFVIKPPLDRRQSYSEGKPICFDLVIVGKAQNFLPYFIVSLRELGERGIGIGRGRFDLERIVAVDCKGRTQTVYVKEDPTVRPPDFTIRFDDFEASGSGASPAALRVRFITPVLLKHQGE